MTTPQKLPEANLDLLNRINLPDGVSVDSFWDSFIITRRWFSPKHIGTVVFAVIWNGFLLYGMPDLGIWLFLVPHCWFGIGMAYYALTHLFNTTTITISTGQIIITHQPIPYPGHKKLAAENIRQLYVKSKRHRKEETFEVRVITDRAKDVVLLAGIDQMAHALMIEQTIEGFLGIEDEQVMGEAGGDPAVFKFSWNVWKKFAHKNQFHFVSGKYLEAYGVHGDYQGSQFKLLPRSNPMGTVMTLSGRNPTVDSRQASLTLPDVEKLFGYTPLKGKMVATSGGLEIIYEQNRLETDPRYLQSTLRFMATLHQAYPKIVSLEAEAIPLLEPVASHTENTLQNAFFQLEGTDHPLQGVAEALIKDISHKTKPIYPLLSQLWCRRCLVCFAEHAPQIPGMDAVTYCGCRLCHQSRAYYQVRRVVAVLDEAMDAKPLEDNKQLRVNWLARRALFDFGEVEIIRASDEDVERFAVQVGNDTDPHRQPHYKNMTCRVACPLSPNSAKILERTFGEVKFTGEALV